MSCGTHKNCTCQRDVLFSGYKRLFFGIQKIVLDFFGGQSGLINCNILIDILEGQKRAQIGFSTVGDLKAPAAATKQQQSSSKDSSNSRKQQQQKQHKQQGKQHTTRKASSKQQQKLTKTAQKAAKATLTFGRSKAARVWVQRSATPKAVAMAAAKAAQRKQQKQQKAEAAHKTEKNKVAEKVAPLARPRPLATNDTVEGKSA